MAVAEKTRVENRRRSRRSAARKNIKIQCRKNPLGLGPNIATTVLDVSDTGARLIVSEPLDIDSEVELTIDGYGLSGRIKRLGYVRWQVKLDNGLHCVGIEFQKHITYRDWQALVVAS